MDEPNMLQVVLMGIITVFVVLVCLIGIIKLLGLVMTKVAERKASLPNVPAAPAPAQAGTVPQVGGQQQLVAAIAAALAEEMGSDVNHLKIHSIRRL